MANPNPDQSHLKKFEKGNPGKPKGAKNKRTLAIQQLCQDILEVDPFSGKKMTQDEFIHFMKWWAIQTPVVAKHILEHAHGKAKEIYEVEVKKWLAEGPNGEPIVKKVSEDDRKQD